MNRYDEDSFDRMVDFLENEIGGEIRADNVNGFWMISCGQYVVASVSGQYEIYAEASGVGRHNTGKEIGDGFDSVEEVIEKIRNHTGDEL